MVVCHIHIKHVVGELVIIDRRIVIIRCRHTEHITEFTPWRPLSGPLVWSESWLLLRCAGWHVITLFVQKSWVLVRLDQISNLIEIFGGAV